MTCPLCQSIIEENGVVEVSDETETNEEMNVELESNDLPTKVRALLEDLDFVRTQDQFQGTSLTKSIVFSQFTSLLTLCEVYDNNLETPPIKWIQICSFRWLNDENTARSSS
jgi:hypothetical protein